MHFQDLFKRVIPHQCLGAVWSRRDKSRDRDAATVAATIEQFNAVSYRVISTVLMPTEAKPQHRAKVITKWIDIAQVNSKMKDFKDEQRFYLVSYLAHRIQQQLFMKLQIRIFEPFEQVLLPIFFFYLLL